ncbi:MAG: Rha family transcriptional regulator, partial [Lentisphaeraceae bacterium]|nr:Rha family transcriptional regulator [Lentisphaeraceae bacterium]
MNEIAKLNNSCIAMTTKEIADLTSKRHDNIIRDTEKMFSELEINALKFEAVYTDAKNEKRKCYILPKDLTLTLVSGYNIKMRKAIIDRWTELEKKQTLSIANMSRLELLEMAVEQEKKVIALEEVKGLLETNLDTAKCKIEALEPMAE